MAYSQKKRAKEKLLWPTLQKKCAKKKYFGLLTKEMCKEKLFLLEKDLELRFTLTSVTRSLTLVHTYETSDNQIKFLIIFFLFDNL